MQQPGLHAKDRNDGDEQPDCEGRLPGKSGESGGVDEEHRPS